jgi:hypothetical protein
MFRYLSRGLHATVFEHSEESPELSVSVPTNSIGGLSCGPLVMTDHLAEQLSPSEVWGAKKEGRASCCRFRNRSVSSEDG